MEVQVALADTAEFVIDNTEGVTVFPPSGNAGATANFVDASRPGTPPSSSVNTGTVSSAKGALPADDLVEGRFRVQLPQPIPSLNTRICNAYEVFDERGQLTDLYALVAPNTFPYRRKALEAVRSISHPSITPCYGAAPVYLAGLGEIRMAFILKKPRGRKLSEIIQERGALHDRHTLNLILKPLNEALMVLHQNRVNHGCINPDTIYFDNELVIGECVSEPSGFSQDFHYEPPERLTSLPAGKGSGSLAADSYALGVLAIYLTNGGLPFMELSHRQFAQRVMHMGAYNAYMQNLDFSEHLLDLMRGTLNDSPAERWETTQIALCLEGKRYNLIPPSIPRDSSRFFLFDEQEYFSRRALAYNMQLNWKKARTSIAPAKLIKWLELGSNKSNAAEQLGKVLKVGNDSSDSGTRNLSESELARTLALLDPTGPMRYKDVTINIDGLGTALAASFQEKNSSMQSHLMYLIESGLPGFLSDLQEGHSNHEAANILWQLQNLRPLLVSKGLGFGSERILYHLNPSLACQSPMLSPYHCDTVIECMVALEHIAATGVSKQHSLIDPHVAAFIADKIDLKKELRITEFSAYPEFASDSRLVMLRLLAMAQQKAGNTPYPNLAQWIMNTVMPVIGKLHQRSSRELLVKEIKKAANSGMMETIAQSLLKTEVLANDQNEFERAKKLFRYHQDWIKKLQDMKRLQQESREVGRRISITIAYFVLAFAIYQLFSPYINL